MQKSVLFVFAILLVLTWVQAGNLAHPYHVNFYMGWRNNFVCDVIQK